MTQTLHVFFVSDRTGITAETLGNGLLTQFDEFTFQRQTLPFVNTPDKALNVVAFINHVASESELRPLVFSTTVTDTVRDILRGADALFLDLFDTFIPSLEKALGSKSAHAPGRAHGLSDTSRYRLRIDAVNFALEHDDGLSTRKLDQSDIILIAPSRCGKTPTSLYLAMQHGVYATNYPLTEEDLEAGRIPAPVAAFREKLFGLTSDPERLAQVRGERKPGSQYAEVAQCSYELRQAEALYRRHGVPYVNSANMSVEEIASYAMQEKDLRRQSF
jgi:regulator of PEP synthase PpsR (kinase-PPPase family)